MTDLIFEDEKGKLRHIFFRDGMNEILVIRKKGSTVTIGYKEDYDAKIREALMKLEAEMRRRPRGGDGEEDRLKFTTDLGRELEKEGFKVAGVYPRIEVLFYTIEIGDRATIWWGPKMEKLATSPLSVQDTIAKLREVHRIITERPFNDEDYLRKLYDVYNKYIEESPDKSMGVSIKHVISELYGGYDAKWGRVFLGYDIFRLKTYRFDNKMLVPMTATRAYTRKAEDFIWVPADLDAHGTYVHGGTYISHIKFREYE